MTDYSRQSFLGKDSSEKLKDSKIGIVGYGGGGSHFGQQFGHIGIGHLVVVDDDFIEESNRHRFVGSEPNDLEADNLGNTRAKVEIARRQILRGNPHATVTALRCRWQEATDALSECDIIFGAVDSFAQRDELERFCRRNLIPYIDIGMVVTELDNGDFAISGQVVQSLPGTHCLRCCNIVTDERIAEEANQYGDAGPQPQVIWPNGVLASTAVGFGIALLTPWFPSTKALRWLVYDGNTGTLKEPNILSQYLVNTSCSHHPETEVGDPLADIREWQPTDQVRRPSQSKVMFLQRWISWLREKMDHLRI